jgi:hypothetical protein
VDEVQRLRSAKLDLEQQLEWKVKKGRFFTLISNDSTNNIFRRRKAKGLVGL